MSNAIKILHLSDLHYNHKKPTDTGIILKALWKDLENFSGIDFIVFSGDLVLGGDREADLEGAQKAFIQPLLEKTGLPPDRFFPAPGNHDIQRDRIDEFLEEGLRNKLKSRKQVNEFLDREMEKDFAHIERMDGFNRFKAEFGKNALRTSNKLYSTFVFQQGGLDIGIACLNSCWRATGQPDDADKGKLIMGERQIHLAAEDLHDCPLRLAVYHHPLDWLAEQDQQDTENELSREFDMTFCGHLHNANVKLVQSFQDKSTLVQAGSLNKGRAYLNSYAVISIDASLKKGVVELRTYFDKRKVFDNAVDMVAGGRFEFQLKNVPAPEAEEPKSKSPRTAQKGLKSLEKGLELLETQQYPKALEKLWEARQALPENPEAQLFYCIAYLSGKNLLAVPTKEMKELTTLLQSIIEKGNTQYLHLTRLVLAVIHLDFYKKKDNMAKLPPLEENREQLKDYRPTAAEKEWLEHLFPTPRTARQLNLQ